VAVRIIVADDSTTVQKVLKLILAPQGYDVQCFSSGAEAFEAIRQGRPAVIFADAMMSGMNGVELGAKLQKGPKELQEIPFVLMHSAFDEIGPDAFKTSGAKAKLVKPFDDQQVIDIVEKLAIKEYKEDVKENSSTPTWDMDSFAEPEMPDLNDPLKTVKAAEETFDIDLTLAEEKHTDEEGFIKISEGEKIDELSVPEPHEMNEYRVSSAPEPEPEIQKPLSEETLSEPESKKLFNEFNLAENPDGSITFREKQTPPEFKASVSEDAEKDMGLWSERFYGASEDVNVPELSTLSEDTAVTDTSSLEFEKAYSPKDVSDEALEKIARETIEKMLKEMLPSIAEKVVREEIAKIVGK